MLKFVKGNILDSSCEAIVIPVNCVGVMGKGLALYASERYPDGFLRYRESCKSGSLLPGGVVIDVTLKGYYFHLATKNHWRYPSKKEWIEVGLYNLEKRCEALSIKSLAIPAIGCGNGKLDWDWVEGQIKVSKIGEIVENCEVYKPF